MFWPQLLADFFMYLIYFLSLHYFFYCQYRHFHYCWIQTKWKSVVYCTFPFHCLGNHERSARQTGEDTEYPSSACLCENVSQVLMLLWQQDSGFLYLRHKDVSKSLLKLQKWIVQGTWPGLPCLAPIAFAMASCCLSLYTIISSWVSFHQHCHSESYLLPALLWYMQVLTELPRQCCNIWMCYCTMQSPACFFSSWFP